MKKFLKDPFAVVCAGAASLVLAAFTGDAVAVGVSMAVLACAVFYYWRATHGVGERH